MTVTILSHPTHLCYVKQAWADSWVESSLLQGLRISFQAGPGQPSALLKYDYGKGMAPAVGARAADTAPATIAKADLLGWYLRIDVSGLPSWYGVIVDKEDHRDALWNAATPSGTEVYTAMGLTWFLDQAKPITQAKVKYSGGTWLIDRTIPFNGGTDGRRGNARCAWKNYDATNKCFTDSSQSVTPTAWKAKHAIEYVIDNFAPVDDSGSVLIPFALHASALTFLDYEIPMLDYDGQTPWQLINRLVDRRRGLGLTSIVDSGTVKLVIFSQNDASISLPGGGTIPANPNTMTYDFDNALNILNASVTTTLQTRYDQVVVRGERAGSVFTVRPQTNFEPDWTTPLKQKYNDGAKLEPGYSTLSDSDKEAANMDRRAADDLARVFSWWRPKSTWNGRADTDPSTGAGPFAFPKIDADGVDDKNTAANVFRAGLRIQPHIPHRQGVDYTQPITPEIADGDDVETDYIPPMLFLQVPVIRASTADGGWVHCERLNQSIASNSDKRPFTYSVDLAVRDDAPGLILKVVNSPQHVIAQDQFVPVGSFEDIPSGEGIAHNKWLATIYMLQDQYCRAQYPLDADIPTLDLVRQLHLQVPEAYLDYLVPGTIVGVKSGELQKSSLGGWIRDDRKRLKDIARLAFMWFGVDRRILSLSFSGIASGFTVGDLITSIGTGGFSETINTCITSVSYDLQAGAMSVNTQFGEMDFTS